MRRKTGRIFTPVLIFTPILLGSLAFLASASAMENERKSGALSYSAYYGGLSAVQVDARINITPNGYEITTKGRSTGFLDFLFPFSSHVLGTGRFGGKGAFDDKAQARHLALQSTFRGRTRVIEIGSQTDGDVTLSITPPIPLDERDPVPRELQAGTLDPIAALVAAATQPSAQAACSGTLRIFNGKTRTDVSLVHLGAETLAANRFSVFSGLAEKCEARYKTLAGGYKKSWFGSDGPPPVITFWIARIDNADFWTPVRVEAETELAKVLIHLTSVQIGPSTTIVQR